MSGDYATHRILFKGYVGCMKVTKKWTTPKIDEYIAGDYRIANKDDYLLYNAAQRSLGKTIDFGKTTFSKERGASEKSSAAESGAMYQYQQGHHALS